MSRLLKKNPLADGYWMPAEYESHAGTWMLWPERPDNWRHAAAPAQAAFADVATAIARFEPVSVGVSGPQFEAARALLPDHIRLVEMSHDDSWARDVAPTFVVNASGDVRGIDWQFNAWGGYRGGLYAPWDQDQLVTRKILEIERRDRYAPDFVNEGGAIHVDGIGTALVTEETLLNPNRNPRLSRAQIEATLRKYLGVSTVIWLGQGVFNDETDGHIDNLACFVKPGEVVLTYTDDTRDPQYAISQDAWQRLNDSRDARGRKLKVHKLPSPGPLHMTKREAKGLVPRKGTKARPAGDRLAGSYVNFYIANRGIVMPLLDPKRDRVAAAQVKRLFPKHRVVGVQAREVLLGGGNIHCITQQVPAAGGERRRPEVEP